ncbi:PDR/VanB family oxidoreductase [Alcaligenes sp. WGS1538]|uniref:PDR/VanB family oxidoreductase n=1 Tax=Alcaligenes sp. WGS1538 TaxID=3366811 RepID=UPI00372D0570
MSSFSEWPLELVVSDVQSLTAQIKAITLRAAGGGSLPVFAAGAHIMVNVAPDGGAVKHRSYSLINSTRQSGQYEIAVKLEAQGGGGSRFMHALQVGDRLKAGLPRNDFGLCDQEHEAVLIAGGIGITPILSMAHALSSSGMPYVLHYASRSPQGMAYKEVVQALCGPRASLYFDEGEPSKGLSVMQVLGEPAARRHVYVCGPRPLIDAVIAAAKALQWPSSHVHFELFGAPASREQDRPCRVVLQRSALTLDVPAGQSILEAMVEAGVDPMFDCGRGECGACAVRVLAGTPEHRDYALSDSDREEDRLMCVCVSRARSDELVLDA